MSDRNLCPYCRGNSDTCQFCDGGWVVFFDSLSVEQVSPVVQIVDPDAIKSAAQSMPTHRRVVSQEDSAQIDLKALQRATDATKKIEKAAQKSKREYKQAADDAYQLIRRLIEGCTSEYAKVTLQKRLNLAYYHRKHAEMLLVPPGSQWKTAEKSLSQPEKKTAPKRAITLMEQKLRGAGVVRDKLKAQES